MAVVEHGGEARVLELDIGVATAPVVLSMVKPVLARSPARSEAPFNLRSRAVLGVMDTWSMSVNTMICAARMNRLAMLIPTAA